MQPVLYLPVRAAGEQCAYSNIDYWMLGKIVEQVTEQ